MSRSHFTPDHTPNRRTLDRVPTAPDLTLAPVKDGRLLRRVRQLFIDYARAFDFPPCFQGFDRELATLPGEYAPPGGLLLAAIVGGKAVGCVAIRAVGEHEGVRICEMRRLYVDPASRRAGLGHALVTAIIEAARSMGYTRMVLETSPGMHAARALYADFGFSDAPVSPDDPAAGVRRMALAL